MDTSLHPEYGFQKHPSCWDCDRIFLHHNQSSYPKKTREQEEDYWEVPHPWSSFLAKSGASVVHRLCTPQESRVMNSFNACVFHRETFLWTSNAPKYKSLLSSSQRLARLCRPSQYQLLCLAHRGWPNTVTLHNINCFV